MILCIVTYLVVVQLLHLAEVHVGEAHYIDQNEIRKMQMLPMYIKI